MKACLYSAAENLKNMTQATTQVRAGHFLMAQEVKINLSEESGKMKPLRDKGLQPAAQAPLSGSSKTRRTVLIFEGRFGFNHVR